MAGMTEARETVADGVRDAGLIAKDHVPEKIVPPLVIVSTGDPMLEQAGTYDPTLFKYNLVLYCIVGTKPNAEGVAALEDMVEKVIYNLGDWSIDRVSPPEMLTANDNAYLTVTLAISNNITIDEGGN